MTSTPHEHVPGDRRARAGSGAPARPRRWLLLTTALSCAVLLLLGVAVSVDATASLDRSLLVRLHEHAPDGLVATMRVLTRLGSFVVVSTVVAATAGWAVLRGEAARAWTVLLVAWGAESVSLLLKLVFRRPRPELFHLVETPLGYAFPSTHSMLSAAGYGAVALVLARAHPRSARPLAAGAVVLVGCIALSRLVLAVHWPSDVLGGLAGGVTALALGALVLDRVESRATGRIAR